MTTHREPSRLPVRGTIGLGVTAAGLAFLFSLRAPGTTGADLTLVADPTDEGAAIVGTASPAVASASASTSTAASTAPCASAVPVASILPSASVGAAAALASTPDPCASAAPTASAAAVATPVPAAIATPTPTAAQSATLVGDVVSTRFGDVQVQVTVESGTIVDVVALQLPDEDRKSLRISEQVESILAEMALAAQSADIDTISGATYTSRAYEQSLQSALDQLAA